MCTHTKNGTMCLILKCLQNNPLNHLDLISKILLQTEFKSRDSPILSALLRELQPTAGQVFKDNYVLEFLGLPDDHSEGDLQKALIQNMKVQYL